ncbi:MAG: c-type cytochrome biogenesis protein CcmI, partial [Pseudomonadota bacterium]|nr:c-type cytochrome biogenesis protein CcmI [Pseudomonadota bacterium]
MFLWIAFAFLTAAVLAAVLAPLARAARHDEPLDSPEIGAAAVYRDQLHEIAADQTRGVLSAGEAEAARLEVSRRLLASAARAERAEPQASPSRALLEPRHATIA